MCCPCMLRACRADACLRQLHTTVALLTIVAATACEHAAFKVLMDRAANYRCGALNAMYSAL